MNCNDSEYSIHIIDHHILLTQNRNQFPPLRSAILEYACSRQLQVVRKEDPNMKIPINYLTRKDFGAPNFFLFFYSTGSLHLKVAFLKSWNFFFLFAIILMNSGQFYLVHLLHRRQLVERINMF